MRLWICFFVFAATSAFGAVPSRIGPQFIPHFSVTRPASADSEIRVNLGRFKRLNLNVQDLRSDGRLLGSGSQEFSIRCDGSTHTPITISAVGSSPSPLNLNSPTGFVRLNGKSYRGKLTVYAELDSCQVVNTLSMNHYLAGLLNKEMSPSWPLEALKAQAVASRTYALFQKSQNSNLFYDLENSTLDQVYEGADAETPRSHQAVLDSAALILTHQRQAIKAFYHADCGGKTESPTEIWGGSFSYFRPVVCPFHTKSRTLWNLSISRSALEHSLRRVAGLLPRNFVKIASVQAGPLNNNHRLQSVLLADNSGQRVRVAANTFRNALGNTRVKSTAFQLVDSPAGLNLSGQGFGHGVGLCQIGAREMARQGRSFREILQFYYPLAKLERLK